MFLFLYPFVCPPFLVRVYLYGWTYKGKINILFFFCIWNGMVVCNNWNLGPLDFLNIQALSCFKPSPEVWIIAVDIKVYLCSDLIRLMFYLTYDITKQGFFFCIKEYKISSKYFTSKKKDICVHELFNTCFILCVIVFSFCYVCHKINI